MDIVEAEDNADLGLFYGNGDGTFRGEVPFPSGTNPVQLVVADFNGDGKPDLAVADYGSGGGGGMTVILNSPQPTAGQTAAKDVLGAVKRVRDNRRLTAARAS